MRIALVVHGLPPHSSTGVETYTLALAEALAKANNDVVVFAARPSGNEAHLAQRFERYHLLGINWLYLDEGSAYYDSQRDKDVSAAFASFLERAKPDVVHFQHLHKLGFGLPLEAQQRSIPTVYSAHDYYPLTDHYNLLRPDLAALECSGDQELRCKVARRLLDSVMQGDHHGFARSTDLSEEQRALLAEILEGELDADGVDPEWVRAAREEHEQSAQARKRAFEAFDAVFATSKYLADFLNEADCAGDVEFRSCGIDLARFENFDRRKHPRVEERKLRFGFIGGVTKHKGLHLLFDAFEPVAEQAELLVFGDSTDRTYQAQMRERCAEVGAQWRGAFAPKRLVNALRPIDVLVVPSLWSENAPFVVREALAVKRAVIVPDTPPLREAVRSGQDGFFFHVGDVADLKAALKRCIGGREHLIEMRSNMARVKGVHTEAIEWSETYKRLLLQRESGAPGAQHEELPGHLEEFASRYAELSGMSTAELCERGIAGLQSLASVLGAEQELSALLPSVLTRGSRLHDAAAVAERESSWLRAIADKKVEEADWRRAELKHRDEKVAWLEEKAVETIKELDWLRETLAGERAAKAERERELEDKLAQVAALKQECDWLKTQAQEREVAQASLQKELDQAREGGAHAGEEHARLEQHCAELSQDLEKLTEHEAWLRAQVAELVLLVAGSEATEAESDEDLARGLEQGRSELERMLSELGWRRREMEEALAQSKGPLGRFAPALGRRVRGWKKGGQA